MVSRLLRNLLPKGGLTRSVALLASGTAIGQVIALIASPLLTRLYTPEDFGYLAIYSSILSTLVVVGSLRYQLAIPLPEKDEDGIALLIVSCAGLLITTSIVSVILGIWKKPIFISLNALPLLKYWWFIPLGLMAAGLYQAFTYWSIRKNAYGNLSKTKLTQGISLIATQVILGSFKMGEVGLIFGDIIGRSTGTGNLIKQSFQNRFWKAITMHHIKHNAFRYRRFPLISSISALLNSTGLQIPSVLLLSYYGPQVAGWFALSQRLFGIPTLLVGASVSQVYTGKAAELARQSTAELNSLFKRTVTKLFTLALIPSIMLFFLAPQLITFIFGDAWFQTGKYVQALTPMFLIQFVTSPISQTLIILERQDLQLFWDLLRFASVLITLLVANWLNWSDYLAIQALSSTLCLSYVVLFYLNFQTLKTRIS
jgi:O-antigen/teichoic acid export membrane protein